LLNEEESMPRAFVVRLLLSAIAAACIVLVLLQALGKRPESELPLRVERAPDGFFTIHARDGTALPAPLRDADVLALQSLSEADRAAIFSGQNLSPGTSLDIAVIRNGQTVHAAVTTTARPRTALLELQLWVGGVVSMSFMLVLAMLTLWRGRDWGAWGLCAFSLALLLDNALYAIDAAPLPSFWIQQGRQAIQILMTGPALYVMAEALAHTGLASATRKIARLAVATLALAAFGIVLARGIALTYFGVAWSPAILLGVRAIGIAVYALPLLVLMIGYRRATHISRLKIRWVLWSTALLLVTIVLFWTVSQDRHPYLYQLINATQWLALLGYLYAVLRNKLVDVSFVVDRALLYTAITVLTFAVFSLLEYLLHKMAFSEKLSLAFQAGAVFLLAMALSPLHRRLEHWIDRLFFRQQRLTVAALRRFVVECAFVERYERLLEFAIERLIPHCAAVAVYERTVSGYERRAARGQRWPEIIDVDDPAFIALRAGNEHLDLEEVASAAGADGTAFPMAIARNLIGAVICRRREGEQLAPDVRAALSDAARSLGLSLHSLRDRERSRLVADIAAGRVDVAAARARAIALA
jgi:hypothetical protein